MANLLTINQSSVEVSTAGFTPGSTVTLARDTSQFWQGAASLKVVTLGGTHTFEQVEARLPASLFLPGQQYTLSVFVLLPVGPGSLRIYCQSNLGNIGSTPTDPLTVGAWTRYSITTTMPANLSGYQYIALRLDTGSTAQALTYYIDGLQIEQGATATAWVVGTIDSYPNLFETASGADVLSLPVVLPLDTATASESVNVVPVIPDSASGVDSIGGISVQPSLADPALGSDALVPDPIWQVTCIDTMKESRDTCSHPLTAAQIAQDVNLTASLNVTHVTVDCFYDYPSYMAQWVSAVRAAGKRVWFRPHWNAWEGNNGVPATMTPTDYLTQTIAFVQANPSLFQSGDIFDACSEPEQGAYWIATYGPNYSFSPAPPNPATDEFNSFFLHLHTQIQSTLQALGITGVRTEMRSTNSWWLQHPASLYPSTLNALGYCVPDSYPEGNSTDPATCANARLSELQAIYAIRGLPIIIGELGFSDSVAVDDATQQSVLAAELAAITPLAYLRGMNYWVGAGTETSGGHTHLFGGNTGAWTLRPAANTLSAVYAQQLALMLSAADSGAGQDAVIYAPIEYATATLYSADGAALITTLDGTSTLYDN